MFKKIITVAAIVAASSASAQTVVPIASDARHQWSVFLWGSTMSGAGGIVNDGTVPITGLELSLGVPSAGNAVFHDIVGSFPGGDKNGQVGDGTFYTNHQWWFAPIEGGRNFLFNGLDFGEKTAGGNYIDLINASNPDSFAKLRATVYWTDGSYQSVSLAESFQRQWTGDNTWDVNRWVEVTMPVTAVPEPESMAMMLAGLGILGAVSRRRAK